MNDKREERPVTIRSGSSIWTKLALLFGSLAVALVVFEFGFRILGVSGVYHEPRRGCWWPMEQGPTETAPGRFVPFGTIQYTYSSDPRGYFGSSQTIDLVHNSEGWRDMEHSIKNPSGTYRILGLGDSYLWGEGVKREDICLTKLGPLISAVCGRPIETINTGYAGLDTIAERDILRHFGLRYEPDLVILFFVPNDVVIHWHSGPKIEFFREFHTIYESPDWFSGYSYLWSWGRQRVLREISARAYIRQCVGTFHEDDEDWKACRAALGDIQRMCRDNNISFMVAMFPFFHNLDGDYPFQPVHDAVRAYCEQKAIHFLELREHYRSFHGPELWAHPTDQHPNEIAHGIAAQAIADYLKRHPGLLECPNR